MRSITVLYSFFSTAVFIQKNEIESIDLLWRIHSNLMHRYIWKKHTFMYLHVYRTCAHLDIQHVAPCIQYESLKECAHTKSINFYISIFYILICQSHPLIFFTVCNLQQTNSMVTALE